MTSKLEHTCVNFVHSADEIDVFISQFVITAFQIGVKAHNISMNECLIGRANENSIVIDAFEDKAPQNATLHNRSTGMQLTQETISSRFV